MSIVAINDRVAELQRMAATLHGGLTQTAATVGGAAAPPSATAPAATATAPTSFQHLLAQASAPPAPSGGDTTAYDALIQQSARANGVDPALLKALIRQESGFDPDARSPAGASGLTQLMPATAASLGVTDPTDPAQAIEGGARYLRQQLDAFGGDEAKALAAYNAGPGAVSRYGGIPPYAETQQYVTRVLGYASEYRTATTPVTIT